MLGPIRLARHRRSVAGYWSADAAANPPVPLPKDTTVLHVGDSFAAALGVALNRELGAQGVRGILRFKTSSFIPEWAGMTALTDHLVQYDPDLVIITLGANELKIEKPERRASAVKKLVAKLGGRPCVWVGIPLWTELNGLPDVIRENCAPCRYMDTNAMVPDMERVEDGVHPSTAARSAWAKVAVEWLARQRVPTAERPWELRRLPRE